MPIIIFSLVSNFGDQSLGCAQYYRNDIHFRIKVQFHYISYEFSPICLLSNDYLCFHNFLSLLNFFSYILQNILSFSLNDFKYM